jgi:hypothetical protein
VNDLLRQLRVNLADDRDDALGQRDRFYVVLVSAYGWAQLFAVDGWQRFEVRRDAG